LPGVSEVSLDVDGTELAFTVQGPVQPALAEAARLPVLSITSREPSLEEAFLKYYADDSKVTYDV
jgi:ABC-2 type transport system ATP-binding protein